MTRDEPYPASFIGPVGPIHHEEYAFDLLECNCSCATRGRAEVAKGRAEIERLDEELRQADKNVCEAFEQRNKALAEVERLKALLFRHHLRGAYWDSDLAVETRAALEPKP